jgi:hypothetical protein
MVILWIWALTLTLTCDPSVAILVLTCIHIHVASLMKIGWLVCWQLAHACNFGRSALTFDLMTLTFELVDPRRVICGSNYIYTFCTCEAWWQSVHYSRRRSRTNKQTNKC